MATQPVDYNALAKQFGAVSSTPDYSALAKQFGAVGSTPKQDSVPGMPGGQPPGPPKPPLPLQLSKAQTTVPDKTGKMTAADVQTGRPIDLRQPYSTPSTITQGIEQIAGAGVRTPSEKQADQQAKEQGQPSPVPSTGRRVFGGVNKAAGGAMSAIAPVALPEAAATYGTAATGIGLITGAAAQQGVQHGLEAAGTPPEYAETAGTAAGLATGIATGPKLAKALPDSFLPRRDPKLALTQALKPTSTNTTFSASLDRSMPEIKAAESEVGPIAEAPQGKALDHLMTAIDAAKKRVWAQYQKLAGPAANAQIDMTPVADAMVQSIPQKYAMENPAAAAAIMQKAQLYRRTMPLQQAEQFLKETNAELNAQYAKYPPDQRKALAANPQIAYRQAQADASRDAIYGYLDQPGGGAAARELKQRYGALMNMEREAYRRKNVADRQQPDSLTEQFGKLAGYGQMARGLVTLPFSGARGAADLLQGVATREAAKYIKAQQTTDALIRSAFRNYNQVPAPIQMPPPFQPKGLLTSGSIITPPPADTSFVRSVPGMAQPPNPARALPAAPTVHEMGPITPDGSFARGVPAMAQPPNPARALPPATTRITPPADATETSPVTTASPLVSGTGPGPGVEGVTPAAPTSRAEQLGKMYTRRAQRSRTKPAE